MSRKYQTLEAIIDAISKDYSWRIIELSGLKTAVQRAKTKAINTEIRKGILLLYAHWEGFVKFSSIQYLQYIVDQKFKQSELTDNYRCIMFRKEFRECAESFRIKTHISTLHLLLDSPAEYVVFDPKSQVPTKSNLNYSLFENILDTLAIDNSRYKTHENQIDESLLAKRNAIAHGEHLDITKELFLLLYDDIVKLITMFKDDLQNLCCTESYKKKIAQSLSNYQQGV